MRAREEQRTAKVIRLCAQHVHDRRGAESEEIGAVLMRDSPDVVGGAENRLRKQRIQNALFGPNGRAATTQAGAYAASPDGKRDPDRGGELGFDSASEQLGFFQTDIASAQCTAGEVAGFGAFQTFRISAGGQLSRRQEPIAEAPVTIGTRVKRYEIIRHLGQGGMGTVFLARDTQLGRLVALKFLHAATQAIAKKFAAEARVTAQCHHENIVVLFETDEYRDRPYMVFEYLRGQTLRQSLHQRRSDREHAAGISGKQTSSTRVVELMIPVVRALVHAHAAGIVHRDLKPDNIMVTEAGAVKVLDFGIAKILAGADRAQTGTSVCPEQATSVHSTGVIAGTPPYMSPEQWYGSGIDHRSDIWAVGIMLYELVVGRHPLAPLSMGKLKVVTDLDVPMPSAVGRAPNLGNLGPIIDRCLMKHKQARFPTAEALLVELEGLLPGPCRLTLGEDESPFSGLAAFQEADADRFFGRSQEIASIVTRLRSQSMVLVVGPSGAGKSSLVRAGVIPTLKRSGEGWQALVVRPGRGPMAALADALVATAMRPTHVGSNASSSGADRDRIYARLCAEPGYLGAELRAVARTERCRIVMFVDQFEELYTLCTDAAERESFLRCLQGVADDASSPLRVIAAIRSDFLEHVFRERCFKTEATGGLMFLPSMDRARLCEALTAPVEAVGYHFENPALVESMLDALEAIPGALPLLQFAASRLWASRDRDRRLLTTASYEVMGGIAGTLASHADAVLASMTRTRRAYARAILERLVTPERTRAIASMSELRELPGEPDGPDGPDEIEQVVHYLADARLLTIETDGDRDNCVVELIHESLIGGWPKLHHWLEQNQEDAAFLARLRVAAKEWECSGCVDGLLWRDEAVHEARRWYQRYRGKLPRREHIYLNAAFALADRTSRNRRVLVTGTIAFLALLVVAAAVALVWIQRAQREASQQAAIVKQQLEQLQAKERAKSLAEAQAIKANGEAKMSRHELRKALAQERSAKEKAELETEKAQQAAEVARRAEARSRLAAQAARKAQWNAEVAATSERAAKKELKRLLTQERQQKQRSQRELGGVIPEDLR